MAAVLLQAENIMLLELDMPSRTTRDYEGPAISPKVQAALDAALQDEDEIQVDASSFESTTNRKPKASLFLTPGSLLVKQYGIEVSLGPYVWSLGIK
ncbi:hypothetical protein A6R68_01313 [Neotoma lepida]|uniref:Uncharacterized protein n=1 Tax=Neotoma lepida TaxID=56216 RepID=A0A1A6GXS0_NEOLE|nr:hypothetical protein A6R68_01313 [Neotoma lepida]